MSSRAAATTPPPEPHRTASPMTAVAASQRHPSMGLVVGALGVVFGDIGTSPIYALHETFLKTGTALHSMTAVAVARNV